MVKSTVAWLYAVAWLWHEMGRMQRTWHPTLHVEHAACIMHAYDATQRPHGQIVRSQRSVPIHSRRSRGTACCMLHLACCIWHVACWTLILHVASGHVAWWTLHVAGDREATQVFRAEQAVRDGLDHPAGEGGASRSVPCHICTGIRLTQPHARPPTPLTPFPLHSVSHVAHSTASHATCYPAMLYAMRRGIPCGTVFRARRTPG